MIYKWQLKITHQKYLLQARHITATYSYHYVTGLTYNLTQCSNFPVLKYFLTKMVLHLLGPAIYKEVQKFLLDCREPLKHSPSGTASWQNMWNQNGERKRNYIMSTWPFVLLTWHNNCFANHATLPLRCSRNYYIPVSSPQRDAWLCQPLLTACSTTNCLKQTPDMASQMQMALSTLSQ